MAEQELRPLTMREVRSRRKKSIAIALTLLGLVVMFYIVTLVRLQENIKMNKALKKSAVEISNTHGVRS